MASVIQQYVDKACDPSLYQADLALNMEICDIINNKETSYPREAAVAIVRLVNHRNQNVGLLALSLLDNCVKNCGYPFHLQISTKEFLNELVKKFPGRPPSVMTPVQRRILELIQEWQSTIAQTSPYKEDLRHIDDMYRLLSYKGYTFPRVSQTANAVLAPSQQIKSSDELEEEDRKAKSAKLQELIRRGAPTDLAEANALMKIMAGYEIETRPDYKKQAEEELDKIQAKAIQLSDLINSGRDLEGNTLANDLASVCQSNQPKLQKMIGEDETDSLERLLALNDLINQVLQEYETAKRAPRLAPGTTSSQRTSAGNAASSTTQKEEKPLIDLDFGFDSSPGPALGALPVGDPSGTSWPPTTAAANATFAGFAALNPYQSGAGFSSVLPGFAHAPKPIPLLSQSTQPAISQGANLMDDLAGLSFPDQGEQAAPWGTGGALALGSSSVPAGYQVPSTSYETQNWLVNSDFGGMGSGLGNLGGGSSSGFVTGVPASVAGGMTGGTGAGFGGGAGVSNAGCMSGNQPLAAGNGTGSPWPSGTPGGAAPRLQSPSLSPANHRQ